MIRITYASESAEVTFSHSSGRGVEEGGGGGDMDRSSNKSYFSTSNPAGGHGGQGFSFGLPTIHLAAADRRVLAATVESLLSKNEGLVFSTICFIRDVLIRDYPPEMFIQESALCMAILEVAESFWDDQNIPEIACQVLNLLSYLLRVKIVQSNSSDFYEGKGQTTPLSRHRFDTSSTGKPLSNNDTFLGTLCQLVKGLSRTVLYHPKEFHLWRALDSFALTVGTYSRTFPVDANILGAELPEVLMDLTYCYDKYWEDLNSSVLTMCFSSLLQALDVNKSDFLLTYDIRQCLRKLCRCPLLNQVPELPKLLKESASPVFENLNVSQAMESEASVDPAGQNRKDLDPTEAIQRLLISIQNATGHAAVFQAIKGLWGYATPIALNNRVPTSCLNYLCNNLPWRDSLYRFLCVEPTNQEDEDLLVQSLDLLSYILQNLKKSEPNTIDDWIIPLCMEKGCALSKILTNMCLKPDPPYSGTILPNLLRSLFDFYFVLMQASSADGYAEHQWNIFSNYCTIFHKYGDRGFSYPAATEPVLKLIGTFSRSKSVTNQLSQAPKFCMALVYRINDHIISMKRSSGDVSGESYRTQGTLYYDSMTMCQLATVISEFKQSPSYDWMGVCAAVAPCMWNSLDLKVRSYGYQICELLSHHIQGTLALMTVLEHPITIWTQCYHTIVRSDEASIVKQYAIKTIINLLKFLDEIERARPGMDTTLPHWDVLNDIAKLLSNAFWLPTLSLGFGEGHDGQDDADEPAPVLSTPKVLTLLCQLLIQMKSVKRGPFHPEPFPAAVCHSGVCPILFRLFSTHDFPDTLDSARFLDSINSLSAIVECSVQYCQLDHGISLLLIGNNRNMTSLIQLLTLQPSQSQQCDQTCDSISGLRVNVFSLLSVLCQDVGNNFYDLEKCIITISQRDAIFKILEEWLKADSLAKCRNSALTFCNLFLNKLVASQKDKPPEGHHKLLCEKWKDAQSYGGFLLDSLTSLYVEIGEAHEDRQTILCCLICIVILSPSTKLLAVSGPLMLILNDRLKELLSKHYDSIDNPQMIGRKRNHEWLEETIFILSLISSLVYGNQDAKAAAFTQEFVDTCHKVMRWWKLYPDRTLLHSCLEALINFSEGFSQGCLASIFSTSMPGMGPRKTPFQQCLLQDCIDTLQDEMNQAESCHIKTVDILFEFINNATAIMECRNVFHKSSVFQFLSQLYFRDTQKWGPKQVHIKTLYLESLLHISVHSDMQIAITRIPDAVEVLMDLCTNEQDLESVILGLKILRNLSFHIANKTRLLCDGSVVQMLSDKIRENENMSVVEGAAVCLWALIANCEKGKLAAKRAFCPVSVSKALSRIKQMEQASNDLLQRKQDLSSLHNILTTISSILEGSTTMTPSHSSTSLHTPNPVVE